jgi:hypothetical protein
MGEPHTSAAAARWLSKCCLTPARVSAQFKTMQSILAAAEEEVRGQRAFLRKTD